MKDRSSSIFGNDMPTRVIRKAAATKEKYLRRFGDDGDLLVNAQADQPLA